MFKNINKAVFVLLSIFVVMCLYGVLFYEKKELHLLINQHYTIFFDSFFKYITYLGDGILFVIIIIFSFFFNKIEALKYTFTGVLTLLIIAVLKRVIFNTPRPVEVFGADNLHLIEGVKMARWNSLPSGHTATAFAIATLLLVSTKNKIVQLTVTCLAILVGFSRIYLSQHFLIDIFAGALLGIFIGLISIKITNKIVGYNFYKK